MIAWTFAPLAPEALLGALLHDLQGPHAWTQIGSLLGCLLLGAVAAWAIRRLFAAARSPGAVASEPAASPLAGSELSEPVAASISDAVEPPRRTAGVRVLEGAAKRLLDPALMLLNCVVARSYWDKLDTINLFDVAVPLLAAMLAVRLAAVVLRQVLPGAPLIAAFERSIVWLVWLAFALHMVGLLDLIAEALDDVQVPLGKTRLTLLSLFQAAGTGVVTLLLALWLGQWLETRLMRSQALDISLKAVLARLAKAVLILIAVLSALAAAGIDLTVLSVFGGALGVGLGLGLQKLAANYVSGFVVLFERSVRIGDMITVDTKHTGVIEQISTRHTSLRGFDGVQTLIPNEMLISSVVANQGTTEKRVRIVLKLVVAFDTPLDPLLPALRQAMLDADERVLRDPEPVALLSDFTQEGLALELAYWIVDPVKGAAAVRSAVGQSVLRVLRERAVVIPSLQRESQLRVVA